MSTNKEAVSPVKYLLCMNDSEHSRVALKFACARAKRRNCQIDILHVLEPADFQGIGAVADKIREERRETGEAFLNQVAEEIQQVTGKTPALTLREGVVEEAIISAVNEDVDADLILLGASPDTNGRHAHISALVKALGDKLLIPIMVLPGNLTDQQIEELA